MYILQAHNSWSYLSPKKWWMKPFAFMARCQKASIFEQYNVYDVRCFDLRVRFNKKGEMVIAHGFCQFDIDYDTLMNHLSFMNDKECVVRVLHEARNKYQYTKESLEKFREFCKSMEIRFPNIKFYCGRNLYNWEVDYKYEYDPTEDEKYSSVCPPKLIDDWFPWIYAKLHNKENLEKGTDKDILAIDFVNIR